jgi:hypothetical protein
MIVPVAVCAFVAWGPRKAAKVNRNNAKRRSQFGEETSADVRMLSPRRIYLIVKNPNLDITFIDNTNRCHISNLDFGCNESSDPSQDQAQEAAQNQITGE